MENRQPRSPRGRLADPRYRAEMLARLDSLIAVLRHAQQQASAARLARPGEEARLAKMHGNLSKTLDVCDTARRALGTPAPRGVVLIAPEGGDPRPGCFAESTDLAEFQRLCSLGPVPQVELARGELEDLCTRLSAEQV
jgi:hypothetical protein